MTRFFLDISMSLDGYVAGPDPTLEEPLGQGGEQLHEWVFGPRAGASRTAWRAARTTPTPRSSTRSCAGGRRRSWAGKMFSGGAGPWEGDPNADAWWGDEPPFHVRSSSSPITRASR